MADSEPDTSPPADSTTADEDKPLDGDEHIAMAKAHAEAAHSHVAEALGHLAAASPASGHFAAGSGADKSFQALKARSS